LCLLYFLSVLHTLCYQYLYFTCIITQRVDARSNILVTKKTPTHALQPGATSRKKRSAASRSAHGSKTPPRKGPTIPAGAEPSLPLVVARAGRTFASREGDPTGKMTVSISLCHGPIKRRARPPRKLRLRAQATQAETR
jgi:hypothetical protein